MRLTDKPSLFSEVSAPSNSRDQGGTVSRRSFIRTGAAASLLAGSHLLRSQLLDAQDAVLGPSGRPLNSDHGRIKPAVLVPDVKLLRHDGRTATLAETTTAHATAIQLMFTTCSTTCPIQAAIFQHVQVLLPDMHLEKIQLLSLSVSPEDDSAKVLSAWLRRFHAGPDWIAAAPIASSNAQIQGFFGRPNGAFADHSTQVNIVDRQGRLVWRTNEFPAASEIAAILKKV